MIVIVFLFLCSINDRCFFFQLSIMAMIAMTLFIRPKMRRDDLTDGRIFAGSLFYAITTTTFNGMAEIAMTIQKLPVFYKQRNFYFFPAWTYTLPLWLASIPVSFAEVFAFTVLTYYEIGYDPNVGRYGVRLLGLFLRMFYGMNLNLQSAFTDSSSITWCC